MRSGLPDVRSYRGLSHSSRHIPPHMDTIFLATILLLMILRGHYDAYGRRRG
jgi:hypothetical protein